ncbi:MAG: MucBP domain-containing protein, partial [Streptococcus sp.]|nr:MucBP domain-containing protein [Streptococcus sp.]
NYQTEDGTELKAPYTDTPETVAEVVTEKYYVDANGQDVIVSSTKASKNVPYNTKENADEKPEKLTDAQGNVYYLKADATKTAINDVEKDAPAEEGTVVEGVTKVTYIYEKAGSVIVNYKTVDGTPLTGTVVDEDGAGKTVESGAKDIDNGKPGTAYNTADNGMKPTRIKTAEGKVYELVPESTEGEEKGEVVAGETKVVTYVYKEVKGNVVVKYEDTEGNSLAADEQDETDASLNVKYDTADHKKESITKDGVKYYLTAKELKDDSKPATGDVVEGTTTVTYVYEKAGQVVVNYQTEDGTPLEGTADGANVASGAKDTTDAKAGTDYNTADNGMKPNRITTAEGKVYELVPTATKGDETGTVVAGETKEVTYVYKEVTGDVVVHYVDTEGNVIAEDKEDTKGASLNAKYDTTDNKPEKIEKDGTVYYLTEKALKDDSKPENGDVVEGKTEVTYVYEKAGQVVVHYTDEKGN